MARIARVVTTITQEIEISDDYANAGKQEVLNFLAEYQDFSTFVGLDNGDSTMRLTAIQVIDEEVDEIDELDEESA